MHLGEVIVDKIKILHLIPAFGGGIGTYVKNLIMAECDDDFEMDVTGFGNFPDEYKESICKRGGNVYELPNVYKHPLQFIKRYCDLLKHNSYDMLHCHISGYKGFIFKIIAKICGIKIIAVHAHRSNDEKKQMPNVINIFLSRKFTIAFADIFFTCSDIAAYHIYSEKFCCQHDIHMMPNSVKINDYSLPYSVIHNMKYREEFHISETSKIVGHIGRFNEAKNHMFILDIIEEISEDVDCVFLLIGGGELYDEIRKQVAIRKIDSRVRFLGIRKDIPQLLKLMDLFILPSLFEGLPTVMVEAQAAGIEILASDTITKQADLELGLVKYLPIDSSQIWSNEILTELFDKPKNNIKFEDRYNMLKQKGFIDIEMRKKYKEIIYSFIMRRHNEN